MSDIGEKSTVPQARHLQNGQQQNRPPESPEQGSPSRYYVQRPSIDWHQTIASTTAIFTIVGGMLLFFFDRLDDRLLGIEAKVGTTNRCVSAMARDIYVYALIDQAKAGRTETPMPASCSDDH